MSELDGALIVVAFGTAWIGVLLIGAFIAERIWQ